MSGRLQAIITASTLAMLSLAITPFSIFSSGTLALVTLRRGAREGLVVLSGASFVAEAFAMLLNAEPWLIPLYILLVWLPVWLIALVLREGKHISLAVEIAVLLGVVGVIVFYIFTNDPATLWKQWMPKMVPETAPVESVRQMIDFLAPYMTGASAVLVVSIMLLGLFLGRWWQALLYNPGGFKQEFLGLKAQPRTAIIVLVILLVTMGNFGKISEISLNMSIPLFMLYAFIGTAVLHKLLASTNIAKLAVPMFYITLLLMNRTMFPIVALVGLADTWLDIRKINLKKT